jgi:hypothetical protein
MEVTKKGRFTTDFYGSRPSMGYEAILKGYVEQTSDKALLSMAAQVKKKGEKVVEVLERILSVCHRDDKGRPYIGNWMFLACWKKTCITFFNVKENKNHPKQDRAVKAIKLINPREIYMTNGRVIDKPTGVRTYAMGKGFFKAYEYVKAGAEFEITFDFDSDVLSEEHRDYALSKMGLIGVGAFRERFGKFEWI